MLQTPDLPWHILKGNDERGGPADGFVRRASDGRHFRVTSNERVQEG